MDVDVGGRKRGGRTESGEVWLKKSVGKLHPEDDGVQLIAILAELGIKRARAQIYCNSPRDGKQEVSRLGRQQYFMCPDPLARYHRV